jgi:transposase
MESNFNFDNQQQKLAGDRAVAAQSKGEAEAEASQAPVRLRRPERKQMAMVVQCTDDLVAETHPVRMVEAVVARLDVSSFCKPIKAREGTVGRDATDPRLLIGLWLYGCIRGIGSARELARRCDDSRAFRWLCGGVSVNHHLLSDFRVDHGEALDQLLTRVIASLVDQGLVKVSRVSQDGVRVRVSVGASSFRREKRLEELLEKAKQQVEELRKRLEDPEKPAGMTSRKAAAQRRAAVEKQQRLEKALEQIPELKKKQARAARRAGQGKWGKKVREREPRVSTTDPEARRMKMANGGFNPAVNVQLATDTESRAVVGMEVSAEGCDSTGLSEPMRKQVEYRSGSKVRQQLLDGGFFRIDDIHRSHEQKVELFIPPKSAKSKKNQGRELEAKKGDSAAILAWKQRMASAGGQQIYKLRAATSETVNADLRCYRGLTQMTVRGLAKARCVALWCVLAYNLMHFGQALLG